MFVSILKCREKFVFKMSSFVLSVFLFFQFSLDPAVVWGQSFLQSPVKQQLLEQSQILPLGLSINPKQPLQFDLIVDINRPDISITSTDLHEEGLKLTKYFLTALTLPEDQMWVNLNPAEPDRIVPNEFGLTEMGRQTLWQDYVLKQVTSTFLNPDHEVGRKFWNTVYSKMEDKGGVKDIPVELLNKVWIVPEKADIYQNGTHVFVTDSRLKVLLEDEYLSSGKSNRDASDKVFSTTDHLSLSTLMQDIVIPEIEREVNQGKQFSSLRQIYHSLILATWYKQNLRKSLLGSVFADQAKVEGFADENKGAIESIYNAYIKKFAEGNSEIIREEYDPVQQTMIPRRYLTGGAFGSAYHTVPGAMTVSRDFGSLSERISDADAAQVAITVDLGNLNERDEAQLPKFVRTMIGALDLDVESLSKGAQNFKQEISNKLEEKSSSLAVLDSYLTMEDGPLLSLIDGTGTNIAVRDPKTQKIYNLESAGFKDPILDSFADEVDLEILKDMSPKGDRLFEKMVSGEYLGEQLRRRLFYFYQQGGFLSDSSNAQFIAVFKTISAKAVSAIAKAKTQDEVFDALRSQTLGEGIEEEPILEGLELSELDIQIMRELSQAILQRSSQLIAMKMIGTIEWAQERNEELGSEKQDLSDVLVPAEGSVIKHGTGVKEEIAATLSDITEAIEKDYTVTIDLSGKTATGGAKGINLVLGRSQGESIVVDIGGSGARVSLEYFEEGQSNSELIVAADDVNFTEKHLTGSIDVVIQAIVSQIEQVVESKEQEYFVSITAALPIQQYGTNKGKIVGLSKKFQWTDAVGQNIEDLFRQELDTKGLTKVQIALILNDTVRRLLILQSETLTAEIDRASISTKKLPKRYANLFGLLSGDVNGLPLTGLLDYFGQNGIFKDLSDYNYGVGDQLKRRIQNQETEVSVYEKIQKIVDRLHKRKTASVSEKLGNAYRFFNILNKANYVSMKGQGEDTSISLTASGIVASEMAKAGYFTEFSKGISYLKGLHQLVRQRALISNVTNNKFSMYEAKAHFAQTIDKMKNYIYLVQILRSKNFENVGELRNLLKDLHDKELQLDLESYLKLTFVLDQLENDMPIHIIQRVLVQTHTHLIGMVMSHVNIAIGMPDIYRTEKGLINSTDRPSIFAYLSDEREITKTNLGRIIGGDSTKDGWLSLALRAAEVGGIVTINGGKIKATELGLKFQKFFGSYGVPASYPRIIENFDEFFKGSGQPFELYEDAHMKLFDSTNDYWLRLVDIWGSGSAHGTYIGKIKEQGDGHDRPGTTTITWQKFNNASFEQQPQGMMNFGSGNGENAKKDIWTVLDSQRGENLDEHPLVYAVTDLFPSSLNRAKENLLNDERIKKAIEEKKLYLVFLIVDITESDETPKEEKFETRLQKALGELDLKAGDEELRNLTLYDFWQTSEFIFHERELRVRTEEESREIFRQAIQRGEVERLKPYLLETSGLNKLDESLFEPGQEEKLIDFIMDQFQISFAYKGKLVPGYATAADLLALLIYWGKYAQKHGVRILELHDLRPNELIERVPTDINETMYVELNMVANYSFTHSVLQQIIPFVEHQLIYALSGAEFQKPNEWGPRKKDKKSRFVTNSLVQLGFENVDVDQASVAKYGGVDWNMSDFEMNVDGDEAMFNISKEDLQRYSNAVFAPSILKMRVVDNWGELLGVDEDDLARRDRDSRKFEFQQELVAILKS